MRLGAGEEPKCLCLPREIILNFCYRQGGCAGLPRNRGGVQGEPRTIPPRISACLFPGVARSIRAHYMEPVNRRPCNSYDGDCYGDLSPSDLQANSPASL